MNDAAGTADDHVEGAELRRRISTIWRDVLNARDASPDATFLELQGQSISAVRIVGRIEEEIGIEVDAAILFEDPDMRTFVDEVVRRAGPAG
ncbi:phosphopantetheine-binding protein [Micromonospora sp. KLBMP9576]|uniref:phosphopantetheine-binding protein n=1 Tax=Micromonospora sp. KLBMP9576 TaxID=3424769 RepID=UPI003D8DF138